MSDQYEIQEETPDHHFRTEIPNLVFDLGLSPEAFCLYAHLKRIAGDKGACFKSNKNLAKDCGIGETKLRECFKELTQIEILIGDDPSPGKSPKFHSQVSLIKITQRKKENGSWDTNLVTITPIWRLNGDIMRSKFKKINTTSQSEGGVPRNPREGTSQSEDKEEPSKQDQKEQQQRAAVSLISACLEPLQIPIADKQWISDHYTYAIIENAVKWATHKMTKINTTLQQAIKWACANQPQIPLNPADEVQQNKVFAQQLEAQYLERGIEGFSALNTYAEIYQRGGMSNCTVIEYTEKAFKDQLLNALRKHGIIA